MRGSVWSEPLGLWRRLFWGKDEVKTHDEIPKGSALRRYEARPQPYESEQVQ